MYKSLMCPGHLFFLNVFHLKRSEKMAAVNVLQQRSLVFVDSLIQKAAF